MSDVPLPLSRRAFLGTITAAPLAARAALAPRPRIAVVGAGAFGGWTALQLLERGADVTLLDAWGPGNSRSSSGGETRVIRALYGADRIYSEMVRRSFELWGRLGAAVQDPLYVETGVLWMMRGDDVYVRSAVPILKELGFPLERIEVEQAARRWPQIDFRGVASIWLEARAGALYARRCCMAVRHAFAKAGGRYRTAHVEPAAIAGQSMQALRLGDGSRVDADAYVFACGPWLGRLFPDAIGERVRPSRQEVYFFGAPRGSERYHAGNLPVWIDFGERIFYGLPDVDGRGFKIADDTRGATIDPTAENRTPDAEGIARARRLLAERFPEMAAAPLVEARVCQYENSPDGHLILDRHPGAKNVWIAGGGSGHGFKLGPAVGEMLTERILFDKPLPEAFRLARLDAPAKATTQFEKKG